MRPWAEIPPERQQYLKKVIADWPPLSEDQLERLRLLLGPSIRAARLASLAEVKAGRGSAA
jgi:hypothetical protein